jgi:hypothetical protein
VLADGVVVGRIFEANSSPAGTPWMWTLAFGHHEDRRATHGYQATREAAVAAFAKRGRMALSPDGKRNARISQRSRRGV